MSGRILVVDDDEATCEFVALTLGRHELDVVTRTSPNDALDLVAAEDFDAILTDLEMAQLSGLELCERIVGMRPQTPVIVVTAHGNLESAVAAMRVGAYDFLTKPVDTKLLALSVRRAVQHRRLRDEVKRLEAEVKEARGFGTIIGESRAMHKVFELVASVAGVDASVLITGESGTGKELVARAIHGQSANKDGPFVAINCAAVPPTLLESELFGHSRGAFTDAKAARPGLFLQANGGTLFLDEIGEMPLEMQAKLLRSLQERKVRPVGGDREVPFDARLLAATNRDLEHSVHDKSFREDLYYRINVVTIDVPPLRARGDDVLLLAQHFIERAASRAGKAVIGLSPAAARQLCAYEWPGNVRELENCMERAVALTKFEQITVEDLPERVRDYHASKVILSAESPEELITLEELERRYVMRVLNLVGGNKSRAAEILGLNRRTIYRMLDKLEAR